MRKCDGFTLVELLVTLVLVVIVSGVMYALYKAQNQTTVAQSHVADMQQVLRASAEILSREIRMAGYDPSQTGHYGITKAVDEVVSGTPKSVMEFTADLCENGRVPADDTGCTEIYSIVRNGNKLYKANTESSGLAIAENIEEFEFCYSNGEDPCELNPSNLKDIEEVILSILVRSFREDSGYKNSIIYKPGSHSENFGSSSNTWGDKNNGYNDGYHRRMLIKRITLRNMGH